MFVYASFFFLVVGFLLVARILPERQSSAVIYIVLVILILFAGLRGLVGSDTLSYLRAYEGLSNDDYFLYLLSTMEPLFVALLVGHKYLFDNSFLYLFMMSVFQVFLLWKVCENSSDRCLFLVAYALLFYLNFHFNIARSAIASMLFLYSLCSKSRSAGLLAAVLAPGFHVSVLMFYPLLLPRLGVKYFSIIVFICLAAAAVFYQEVYDFSLKFKFYADYLRRGASGVSIYGLLIMVNVVASVVLLSRANFLFFGSSLFLIVSIVLYGYHPIAYRFVTIALLLYLFFLLEALSRARYSWGYIFFWAPVILTFGVVVQGIANESDILNERINAGEPLEGALNSTYIPYEFYWDDELLGGE
jgi:hypothetical protein